MTPGDETVASAHAAAQRAAMALSHNNRNLANAAETRAQLTVVRRILGNMLPGGEAEFWQLVEKELRR